MTISKRFEDLRGALDWLLSSSWENMKPGLERTRELLDRLGNPQDKLKIIHIAGTNGKGSTSAMLSQVYSKAGFKVGLYSSPELSLFNERIRIDNKPISNDDLLRGINQIAAVAEGMEDHPSQFELATALAFQYFEESGCDLVVLETGLGGRLDSTNVVKSPLATIITPISYDHTGILGSSLAEIAKEKAGILKDGVPLALAPQKEEALNVIFRQAGRKMSSIYQVKEENIRNLGHQGEGQHFSYTTSLGRAYEDQVLNLLGDYQLINAATVLEAIDALAEHLPSPREAIREAFKTVTMPGRFEILKERPLWIADVAHNPQGIEALVQSIQSYYPKKKVNLLFAVFADKEVDLMLKHLSVIVEDYSLFPLDHARAMPLDKLEQVIQDMDPKKQIHSYESLEEAVRSLEHRAQEDNLILACGSLSFMGSLRDMILGKAVSRR